MNPMVILLMLASFTGGMVWMKVDKIYDYFLPEETEQVEEVKKDDNPKIILVPVQVPSQPTVQPKPTSSPRKKGLERDKTSSGLFCSTEAGLPQGNALLELQGS